MHTLEIEAPAWRCAALRGLARLDGRDEALVAVGGGQFLRIALAPAHAAALHAWVGRRVWVDARTGALRTEAPAAGGHD